MPINFPSPKELRKHTRRHWQEFNLAGEHAIADYLALVQVFCDCPCPADAEECIRTCDVKIDRFCDRSSEFAVFMPGRSHVLTFHILHPRGTAGVPVERTHLYDTNRQYYEADCRCLR